MSQGNRQNRQFALTYDQRLLLDMYINFYNHTTRQMDALYDLQSEIRGNINEIIGISNIHNNSHRSQNSNRNFTESFTNNRQNNQTGSNRRNNQNRNQQNNLNDGSSLPSSNSRVVYIEGVPYLLDLTNFMRLRNQNNTDTRNLWRSFYENITVAPTRIQIENSTRIVQFSDITTPINSSCPITLERFDENSSVTQILHCGHIFTPTGIESWFQSNVRCPVCRYDIRDYRAPPLPPSTREERHRETEPGNDEDTNEEDEVEETKEDVPITNENERRSNPIRRFSNQRSNRITSENVTNVLSNITEEIINNIFHPNGNTSGTRSLFDPSQNSLFYDSSNNQFIFEGFIRR